MFKGRYGADRLGFIFVLVSILLSITALILSAKNFAMKIVLLCISCVILLIAILRMLSKNIEKRNAENEAFLYGLKKIGGFFKSKFSGSKSKSEIDSEKTESEPIQEKSSEVEYRHFRCPKCKKHLKVPANKGYIKVSCPACNYKFTKRT